jgi:hypothetical protein
LKCHVPRPRAPPALVPKSQTLVGLSAVMPLTRPLRCQPLITSQCVPFQCSTKLAESLTAQMSRRVGALASLMKPDRPAGSVQGRQWDPSSRTATGELVPPGFVPPKAHISDWLGATTAE